MTTLTHESTSIMEPISLDELVESAELLTRVDRKYVVPVREVDALISCLQGSARILDIDGRREFGYRSAYYDTPHRESFLTSGRSRRLRLKVRTRTYLDTGSSWLEVKTRQSLDQTV
ncbi:MAG: polyphosphate polymerase protein, partial [Aeromicrobium sp.]|nr:polyphosphate polymerase protein [Aeromicrobium sp.]